MRVTDLTPWVAAGVIEPSNRLEWKPGPWADEAVCAETDPEAFFPNTGESVRPAKQVCSVCPVRAFCLAFAVVVDDRMGVWGGLSAKERDRLKTLEVPGRPGVVVKLQKRLDVRYANDADRVAELTAAGKSAAEISEMTGTTARTVQRQRARHRASAAASTEQAADAA